MRTLKTIVANFFAKNSCPAWQSVRLIRRISRKIYRLIMETGAKHYPYANLEFANWAESEDKQSYSLVTDSSNFVIRHGPSYCAWMIKQATGEWLRRPSPGKRAYYEHDFDAKHWDELLHYNGWTKSSIGPVFHDSLRGTHFIGIIKDEGEYGQVVWFEYCKSDYDRELDVTYVKDWIVSTYKNSRKEIRAIPAEIGSDIIWYVEPEEEYA